MDETLTLEQKLELTRTELQKLRGTFVKKENSPLNDAAKRGDIETLKSILNEDFCTGCWSTLLIDNKGIIKRNVHIYKFLYRVSQKLCHLVNKAYNTK